MILGKSILGIIPARGGSKGIPRKNITNVAGKPLIAWTIEAAKGSKYLDRLIISSEDDEIISVALQWGCEAPFVRPKKLAQDSTPGIEPVIHALKTLPEQYDYVVLLQPTSPLRTNFDIDGCIEKCIEHRAKACVSVSEVEQNPYWMYLINEKDILYPLHPENEKYKRRQDLPRVFGLNGAVYVAESKWLLQSNTFITEETVAYIMPRERALDIDTEIDLAIANIIIKGEING